MTMKTLMLLAAVLTLQIVSAAAAGSIYDIPLKDIDGKDTTLKPYAGKVLLIVNVASKCGFTPQYTQLELLYSQYKVNGEHRHALYNFLTGTDSPFPGKIGWNFTKYLIGRDGTILNRFNSPVKPLSPEFTAAVEKALAAK